MQYLFQSGLLTGSPVDVVEMMYRYTTEVIASCAFGIIGNSLKDPQAEFRNVLRKYLTSLLEKVWQD
jgi:cytochrome P450 family 6